MNNKAIDITLTIISAAITTIILAAMYTTSRNK